LPDDAAGVKLLVPLGLTASEIDAIVAFLRTLEGEGYQDQAPRYFPQ
jgi:hypothetical protein